jgi:multidrug efflux pump subunit AcrA (membrane-fusion protein)
MRLRALVVAVQSPPFACAEVAMLLRIVPVLRVLVVLALIAGAGAAAYLTRDSWWPHVFPTKPSPSDEHADHPHEHPEVLKGTITPLAQQNLGIVAKEPVPQEYWRKMVIPGVVVDLPGESDRRVATTVAGVVTDVRIGLGDGVKPGDPLFTIQLVSELLQTTQAELGRVAIDLKFAKVERDRLDKAVKAGTATAPELATAQNQVDRLEAQAKAARRQLLALGLTEAEADLAQKGDPVSKVVIRAPTSNGPAPKQSDSSAGWQFDVRSLRVALGDHVQAGQVLCELADHRRLLVEGSAFKSEARALAHIAASRVAVEVEYADENPGQWPAPKKLYIRNLSEHVDPQTRTFSVFFPLENEEDHGVWRFSPGQRVRLRVPVERLVTKRPDGTEVDPFVLPPAALVREGAEAFVFVKVEDVFVRRPVRVLHEDATEVVIANDGRVTKVDLVVRNQAAAINRALKAPGDDHGHGHHHHDH